MSGVKEASCYSSSTISQLWYLLDESNQLSTPLDAKSSQDGISGSGSIFGTPFFDRLFAGRSFKLEIPAKIINHLDNYKLLIKKEHIHKLLFLLSSIKNSFFNKKDHYHYRKTKMILFCESMLVWMLLDFYIRRLSLILHWSLEVLYPNVILYL